MRLFVAAAGLLAMSLLLAGCGGGQPVAEIRPEATTVGAATASDAVAGDAGSALADSAADIQPADTDWPAWRGAAGTGIAVGPAPTEWSSTKNVAWSVPVPGKGHASPSVWGEQIFLATADEAKKSMSLVSLDREPGQTRWTCPLHDGGFMHVHSKNTQASPTVACDGKHLYWLAMVKDAIWLSAVSLEGKIAWQTEVGPFVSMHGYGSSPVLWKNLVIVQGDSNGPGWLAGVNKETGKTAWRVRRSNGASFATPAVAEVAGKSQLLLHGQDKVISYDPATGDVLWECEGPATVCANTMCWSGDLVFASGGFPQANVFAIRADGSGKIEWRKKWRCYVPSMLVDGELLYVPQDNGVLLCVEAQTGNEHWSKRLDGDVTSSPVLAAGNLYVTTEAGKTFVFRSSKKLLEVSTSELGERCYATPTIVGARIYIRSYSKLFCIAGSAKAGAETGE